jgi:hypothetical protein
LFDFVLENPEVFVFQAVGEALAVVENGGVQNDEADVNLDARALLAGVNAGARRRRRRLGGHGKLGRGGGSKKREDTQESREPARARGKKPRAISGWERSSPSWNRQ